MNRFAACSAALLVIWTIGCGGGKDAEEVKPQLIYTGGDLFGEAWVIEGPTWSHRETGIGVIRIRASSPNKDGTFSEGAALVGLNVGLRINDRVITKVYRVFDQGTNAYREIRLASKDFRFKSHVKTDKAFENPQFVPSPDDSPANKEQPPE